MAAPTVCTISGTLRDTSGQALSNATVSVSSIKPFIHPTDSSLVVNYSVSTTTDSNGLFNLNVIETTTPAVSLLLNIKYSMGSSAPSQTYTYYITVPNSASATLSSLISGQ